MTPLCPGKNACEKHDGYAENNTVGSVTVCDSSRTVAFGLRNSTCSSLNFFSVNTDSSQIHIPISFHMLSGKVPKHTIHRLAALVQQQPVTFTLSPTPPRVEQYAAVKKAKKETARHISAIMHQKSSKAITPPTDQPSSNSLLATAAAACYNLFQSAAKYDDFRVDLPKKELDFRLAGKPVGTTAALRRVHGLPASPSSDITQGFLDGVKRLLGGEPQVGFFLCFHFSFSPL